MTDIPHSTPAAADAAPVAAAPAAGGGEVLHRFEFRGSAGEFFRIWVVNVSLSLLTLGFYAPWAKVRTKRYFYANTFLDGANFEYHASPVSILIARIIVIFVLVGGTILLSPEWYGDPSGWSHTLLLFVFLPWAWVRGLSFNARNSSYRNLRFSFRRAYGFPYLFYGLLLIGVGFLFMPWLLRGYHRFKAERHQFGKAEFSFAPVSVWKYAVVYGNILVFMLLVILPFVVYIAAVHQANPSRPNLLPPEGAEIFLYFAAAFYLILILLFLRLQAAIFILFWDNIRTINGGAFQCRFPVWEFARLLFVNFFATVVSLGLLSPWAKVRKTKFLAAHMAFAAPAGLLDDIAGRRRGDESALGEEFEASEGFDFDVGIF